MLSEILHHSTAMHAALRRCSDCRNFLSCLNILYVTLGFDAMGPKPDTATRNPDIHIALRCPDPDLFQWGSRILVEAGYAVRTLERPDVVPADSSSARIRLAVLLQSILNEEAIEWCRNYCAANAGVPLLVISKYRDTAVELNILKTGADRYLSYPVVPELLAAHIETLTRRITHSSQTSLAALHTDRVSHCVRIGNSELQLAPVLFRLLDEFLSHPGEVLTFDALLAAIQAQQKPPQRNVVKAYVHQLRKILAAYGYPDVIKTLHRVGYRYDPPAVH